MKKTLIGIALSFFVGSALSSTSFDPITQVNVNSKPFESWVDLAEKNDPEALMALGIHYEYGYKVKKDPKRAFELIFNASTAKNHKAQAILGRYYEEGFGIKQSYKEAFRWYQISAAGGNPVGEYNLSSFFSPGKEESGVAVNEEKSLRLLESAADKGLGIAKLTLGIKFSNGLGVKQDHTRATELFREAADLGELEAIYNLGVSYARGEGVSRNLALCVALHSYANLKGFSKSFEALTKILPYVPPPEFEQGILLAEKMSAENKVSAVIDAEIARLKENQAKGVFF